MENSTINPQYDRVKGGPWFDELYKRDVMILGQGGIGSWLTVALSRVGARLYTFDMDTFERHNMSGQAVLESGIGLKKTVAVKALVNLLSPDCVVECFGEYNKASFSDNIVLCGFDNMNARKIAFERWLEYLAPLTTEQRRNCFFQDGRLNVEQIQIYSIPGDQQERIDSYLATGLPSEESVPDQGDCTFKQTTHAAMLIAGYMTTFLTNWVTNFVTSSRQRQVPYNFRLMLPVNMTMSLEAAAVAVEAALSASGIASERSAQPVDSKSVY